MSLNIDDVNGTETPGFLGESLSSKYKCFGGLMTYSVVRSGGGQMFDSHGKVGQAFRLDRPEEWKDFCENLWSGGRILYS